MGWACYSCGLGLLFVWAGIESARGRVGLGAWAECVWTGQVARCELDVGTR
jgi:hypothetical protein